jgi:dienelactone hydrolase
MPRHRAPLARVLPFLSLVAAATASPLACSSTSNSAGGAAHDGGVADAGAAGDAGSGLPVARFVLGNGTTPPNYLDVPFPTDAYLANGSVLSKIPGLETVVPTGTDFIDYGLARLNGFSRIGLATFAVEVPGGDAGLHPFASARIDPATLPVAEADCTTPTSSVYLVDLAPASGASPLLPCRAGFHDDQPRAKTTPAVISVGPPRGYLLQEAHQYAAVVTSRVKDTSGHALGASADFLTVASGTAPGPIGAAYAKAYGTANAALKSALAGDGATIVSMSLFTTMKKTGELFAIRDALESAPAPTLSWDSATMAPMAAAKFAAVASTAGDAGPSDAGGEGGALDAGGGALPAGFTASLDDWLGVVVATDGGKLPDGTDNPDTQQPVRAHDKLAAVGTAVFSAMSYLQTSSAAPYSDPTYGTFKLDSNGVPVAQANVKIWVTFTVPKSPMPAGGYPTVIFQHGLSGSRSGMMALANVFAQQGWLCAAIDSVTFGARAPEPANTVDTGNNFAGTGSTYTGPDGFADTENGSTDFFGGLLSVAAMADQFREAGFDTAQVVKLLRSGPDLSPLDTGSGAPKVDPTRIAYFGISLGAMEGTIAAAIEPRVQAWFLDVNAGSLFPEIAAHSPIVAPLLATAATINFSMAGDVFDWTHPLLQMLEDVIEPGDPVSYAAFLSTSPHSLAGSSTKPRNALQTEDIWDDFVTCEGSEAIARAAGWGMATPNVGSNAEIASAADATNNPRATPFTMVNPDDAGAIHDTPVPGSTAVLFQVGPADHGADAISSIGDFNYAVPYGAPPFATLATPVPYAQDFLTMQKVGTQFFQDAFAGTVPRLRGFDAPARENLDGGVF